MLTDVYSVYKTRRDGAEGGGFGWPRYGVNRPCANPV
jgi:hypothetical protein